MEIVGSSSSSFVVQKKQAETDPSSSIVSKKLKISDQSEQHEMGSSKHRKIPDLSEHNATAQVYEWFRCKVGDCGIHCKLTCSCSCKVTDDWLQFKIDMPGLSLEDVKVSLEGPTHSTVRIFGQGKELPPEEDDVGYVADVGYTRQYIAVFAFQIGESEFLLEDYTKDMNNGLFMLRFPKVKDFTFYRWTSPFDKAKKNSQGEAQFLNYTTGKGGPIIIPPFADPTLEKNNKIMEFFTFKSYPSDEIFPHFAEGDDFSYLDDDKLVMWFDMPGLELNHVQIEAVGDSMIIKAEGIESPKDDDQRFRRYATGFTNLLQDYDFHARKTAMKNGVFEVEVPKVKKS